MGPKFDPRSFDSSNQFDSSKSAGFKSSMGSVDQFNSVVLQNSAFDDGAGGGGIKQQPQFNQQFLNQRQFEPSSTNFAKSNSFNQNTFTPQANFHQQQQQPNKWV